MVTFAEMERRLKRVSENLPDITSEAIEETRGEMIEQQRQQMSDGFLKTGAPIAPPYAQPTIAQKRRKGQVTSHVTLESTGLMKDMIYVDVRPSTYIIDSARMVGKGVLLSPFLEKMYGPSIWGLGGRYKEEYIRVLKIAINNNIQKRISSNA